MKLNTWFTLALGTSIAMLVSCTPNTTNKATNVEQAQQEIKITGAGSPYPAMKVLAAAYEAKTENTVITFLPKSQSPGGIAGAKDKLVDLGTVTRTLKPEEDDGSLVYREIAKDGLVVATNPSVVGVTNLQTEQLKAIYSGKVTNWQKLGGPDATIIVLDRHEDESAKKLLRKYYLGSDLKNAPEAVILRHEADLIAAVQSTPYSIGAFSLAYAIANQLPVNRLSLDGVEPTPENIQSGKYTMARRLGIVYPQTPSDNAQTFIDFAFSKEGGNHLLESGFIPSSQEQE